MQNGWGRRHTMSSVDVTTFVIYSLILCAVAQWNLNTTETPKIEGGEGARRTKSSFDGTGHRGQKLDGAIGQGEICNSLKSEIF